MIWSAIPFPWKVGAYAVIAGLLILVFLSYRNSLINLGKQQGRQEAANEIEKAKKLEWTETERKLADESDLLQKERERVEKEIAAKTLAIASERALIDKERKANQLAHETLYSSLSTQLGNELETLRSVPDSSVDLTLRDLSRRITEWQSQRTRKEEDR